MLKQRILTALVLAPVLILAIYFLPMPWFAILMGGAFAWAGWEWSGLLDFTIRTARIGYTIVVITALIISYFLPINWVLVVALVGWLWAAMAMLSYACGHTSLGLQYRYAKALLGLLALVPCWLAIGAMREKIGGPGWLLLGLLLIWGGMDTGAYIAGRLWGKRPLVPRVSPKKTWEGLYGGLTLTLLLAVGISLLLRASPERMLFICILAIATAIFSVLGDLIESMLKRQAGIKDSGVGLPGHGGILDRIDSVAAALPVFALGSLFLLNL